LGKETARPGRSFRRSQIDTELQILHKLRRPLVACNNMVLLKQLVLNGLGIAFYTPIGFLPELEQGTVRAVPLSSPSMSKLRVGLLLHRRRRPRPAAVAILEALEQALRSLGQQLEPTRKVPRVPARPRVAAELSSGDV
jgi:DNA-binding transcriptional LysR family regulator